MTPRNQLARQIYLELVKQDLDAALRDPLPAARRAVILADAFTLALLPNPSPSDMGFGSQSSCRFAIEVGCEIDVCSGTNSGPHRSPRRSH